MADIGIRVDPDSMVLWQGRDFKWNFEILGEDNQPQDFPDGRLYLELDTGGQHNNRQKVTLSGAKSGTYKLKFKGASTSPIDYNDVTHNAHGLPGDIAGAVEALPGVGAGNVVVENSELYPSWAINLSLNSEVNEVQQITFHGGPTGGDWKASYGLEFTDKIPFGSTAEVVKAKLEALPSIGANNTKVTKVTDGYQVEFVNSKKNTNMEQLVAWSFGLFFDFSLTGGFFPSVSVSTLVNGAGRWGEQLINVINKTINDLFNSFDSMLGVDIDMVVHDSLNMTLKVTGTHSFNEIDLLTFGLTVTSDMIVAAFNNTATFLGIFNNIDVQFYWTHSYDIEFIGALAQTEQPAITADDTGIVGFTYTDIDGTHNSKSLTVEVLAPGRNRFTIWEFDIDADQANLKVESEDVDKVRKRTPWQLVFLATGEPAGGDPIGFGRVEIVGSVRDDVGTSQRNN